MVSARPIVRALLVAAVALLAVSCEEQSQSDRHAPVAPPRPRGNSTPASPSPAEGAISEPSHHANKLQELSEAGKRAGASKGLVYRWSQTRSIPLAPPPAGRNLGQELTSGLGDLSSCLAVSGGRTRSDWETTVGVGSGGVGGEVVTHLPGPALTTRSISIRATITPSGHVNDAQVTTSPSVDATQLACLRARVQSAAIAPIDSVQTVNVTVNLQPRG